jgi:MFS family permease
VRAIALTLCGWIVMIVLAWLAESAALFWVAANIAGLCMGASQSAGRAMVGYLAPPSRLAEFFGLWGLAVKLASIFGPLTYGLANWLSGGDHRRVSWVSARMTGAPGAPRALAALHGLVRCQQFEREILFAGGNRIGQFGHRRLDGAASCE